MVFLDIWQTGIGSEEHIVAVHGVCNGPQTTSDEKFSGENFSSKSSSSSSIVEPSAYAKTTPEIIIENLNEGIVELQLNRLQGKNSLNKKILFEVLYLFFIWFLFHSNNLQPKNN